MKIRWTQNSVRLRITPTELQRIVEGVPVQEDMPLPGGGRWAAAVTPAEGETGMTMAGGVLTVMLSRADAERLAAPETEGVYFQGDPLRYLIEKDFPCVHPHAAEALEPPTETFAEPKDFRERKGVA